MRKKNLIIIALAAVLAGTLLSTACSREDSGSVGAAGTGTATEEQHTAGETEAELTYEQQMRRRADFLAQAMAENGNFTEDEVRSTKEWKLNQNALYDFRDMNEEQIKDYAARVGQVNRYKRWIGLGYFRIRAEVLGKMSADAPRLSVEALDELVKESHSRTELYDNIKSRYGEPDFVFDTEANAVGAEYWLNNEGTEFFLLAIKGGLENGHVAQIALGHFNSEKGSNEGDLLYSTDDLKALYGEGK